MPVMTGGQAVVRSLVREGVEVVFGLPGVQIMKIYDAFADHPEIRLITVRHEQTTTFMAYGYARVKGKPGVALVSPGPGVQNASAGLGTAYAASTPVLLLAGQVETHMLGRGHGALHEINDQLDIVRPITKWRTRVVEAGQIPAAIREAMRQMMSGRPLPAEVEIPPDTLSSREEVEFPEVKAAPPASPGPDAVRSAAALLLAAKKPIIVAGGGVSLSGACAALARLAEELGAPVATSHEGKGAFPEDHPLSLGTGYHSFGGPALAMPQADVVLAVGTRFNRQALGLALPKAPWKLVQIDIDPSVVGRGHPVEIGIVADAKETLTMLLEETRGKEFLRSRWSSAELEKIGEMRRRQLEEHAPLQCQIIRDMRKVLDDDAIIVSGITNVGYWSHLAYPVRRANSYVTASYYATLGFAFPTALGAKVAAPDRPVIALAGDGGFMYALPELATAVKYGINAIALVFVDNAFGASLNDQKTRFQGRVIGTELHNPSFARVAEAFGANGIRTEPENVGKALERALEANRPTVIEVPMPTLPPPFQLRPAT
jgi:acetolactate synthase I/II/III large subunit